MEYKILDEQDLEYMKNVLEDDNMIFNYEYLKSFANGDGLDCKVWKKSTAVQLNN